MYKTGDWRLEITVSFAPVSHKTYKYTPTQSCSRVLTASALYCLKNTESLCVFVCVCVFACIYIHITLTFAVLLCAGGLLSG